MKSTQQNFNWTHNGTRQQMKQDLFDKHIPGLITKPEDPKEETKAVITDRVTINVHLVGPLAGPVAKADPAISAPTPSPPRAELPAARPRTAPVLLQVFESSSSEESVPYLFRDERSSNENLANLILYTAYIARIPVEPLIADNICQQQPEICVSLVSSSSSVGKQSQPVAVAPHDIESALQTREQQYQMSENKLRL